MTDELLALAQRMWPGVDLDVDCGVVYGPPNPKHAGIRSPYLVAPDASDVTLGRMLKDLIVGLPEPGIVVEWTDHRLLPDDWIETTTEGMPHPSSDKWVRVTCFPGLADAIAKIVGR